MNQKQKTILAICAATSLLSNLSAFGSLVPVVNASFEAPAQLSGYSYGGPGSTAINGWSIDAGAGGVWNVGIWPAAGLTAPDGTQIGFLQGGTTISQTLTTSLQDLTAYYLSVAVGGRMDGDVTSAYSISLYAGADLLSSVTAGAPALGVFTTLGTTYTSGIGTSGNLLRIVISNIGPGQLNIDNVLLDMNPAGSVLAVPETSTVIAGALLLVPMGLGVLRPLRKIARAN